MEPPQRALPLEEIGMVVWLRRRSRAFRYLLALVLVALVGLGDWLTGLDMRVFAFYFLPITMIAWIEGERDGIILAGTSALTWFFSNWIDTVGHGLSPLIWSWNFLVIFGAFVVIAHIAANLSADLRILIDVATTDPLTGLLNRRAFTERVTGEIDRCRRTVHPLSIAYIDLDDFKEVNDKLGHAEGDSLLRGVAQTLSSNTRRTDIVGRLGGDEFALVMPETRSEGARAAVEKLRRQILAEFERKHYPTALSVGLGTFHEPPSSFDDFMATADALMYEAKNGGKNSVVQRTIGSPHPEDAAFIPPVEASLPPSAEGVLPPSVE